MAHLQSAACVVLCAAAPVDYSTIAHVVSKIPKKATSPVIWVVLVAVVVSCQLCWLACRRCWLACRRCWLACRQCCGCPEQPDTLSEIKMEATSPLDPALASEPSGIAPLSDAINLAIASMPSKANDTYNISASPSNAANAAND